MLGHCYLRVILHVGTLLRTRVLIFMAPFLPPFFYLLFCRFGVEKAKQIRKKQARSQNGHAEGVLESSGATFTRFWTLWGPFWGALGRPGETSGTLFGHAKLGPIFGPNFGTFLSGLGGMREAPQA